MARSSHRRSVVAAALGVVLAVGLVTPSIAHHGDKAQQQATRLATQKEAIKDARSRVRTLEDGILWAVVQAGGAEARGRGLVSSENVATGQYEVIFDRDVTNCSFAATRGSHVALGNVTAATPGVFITGRLSGEPNGVIVGARNMFNDLEADLAFHLQVLC